uniref:Uncharacterized protein n=1 Tax=Clytia hemisphaerica TaxID=252671 RepID=A0A7M5VAE3_9CNID|eukprot:TCONS_00050362-protein
MCITTFKRKKVQDIVNDITNDPNQEEEVDPQLHPNNAENFVPQETESEDYEREDFIMFTIAVILFCAGSVIAVINAYCMGTKCMRVGSNRDIAHFSPCTFY